MSLMMMGIGEGPAQMKKREQPTDPYAKGIHIFSSDGCGWCQKMKRMPGNEKFLKAMKTTRADPEHCFIRFVMDQGLSTDQVICHQLTTHDHQDLAIRNGFTEANGVSGYPSIVFEFQSGKFSAAYNGDRTISDMIKQYKQGSEADAP
jgi:thioredoxin-related protein